LIYAIENNPPPEIRKMLLHDAQETLKQWFKKEYVDEKVKSFIGKN